MELIAFQRSVYLSVHNIQFVTTEFTAFRELDEVPDLSTKKII